MAEVMLMSAVTSLWQYALLGCALVALVGSAAMYASER